MTARKLALFAAGPVLGLWLAASALGQSRLGTPRPDAPPYKVPDFAAITKESPTQPAELREVIEHYVNDERTLLGRGGFSFGRGGAGGGAGAALPYSEQENSRMRKFYTSWTEGLQKLNFDALNQNGKVDYILLKELINYQLRQLDIEKQRFTEMEPLIPFAEKIIALYEEHQKAVPFDPKDAAARLTALNGEIQTLQTELKR
jgi:hypothetical protein